MDRSHSEFSEHPSSALSLQKLNQLALKNPVNETDAQVWALNRVALLGAKIGEQKEIIDSLRGEMSKLGYYIVANDLESQSYYRSLHNLTEEEKKKWEVTIANLEYEKELFGSEKADIDASVVRMEAQIVQMNSLRDTLKDWLKLIQPVDPKGQKGRFFFDNNS